MRSNKLRHNKLGFFTFLNKNINIMIYQLIYFRMNKNNSSFRYYDVSAIAIKHHIKKPLPRAQSRNDPKLIIIN
jgi:hypothetical protein